MKTLHMLAIRMGWYRRVTSGLPLDVCKTVFGTYFLECDYLMMSAEELFKFLYKWGFDEAKWAFSQHKTD